MAKGMRLRHLDVKVAEWNPLIAAQLPQIDSPLSAFLKNDIHC